MTPTETALALLEQLEAALPALEAEHKDPVRAADRERDPVRAAALKLGATPEPSGDPAPDETTAFARLVAAVGTAKETVRAAVSAYVTDAANKASRLQKSTAYYRGEETRLKAASKRRALTDLRVDPKYDLSVWPEAALPWAQNLDKRVAASAKEGPNRGIGEVMKEALKEVVGRGGNYYLGALELAARIKGAPYALTESVRLFDILVKSLIPTPLTVGGKTFTVHEMAWQALHVRTAEALSSSRFNDKEDCLGWATVCDLVYNMWVNLKTHPENEGRVKRGLELLDLVELKWLGKNGGDEDWRVPNERTLHTALRRLEHLNRRRLMAAGTPREAVYERLLGKWVPLVADEFLIYKDAETGLECATWCYNVLAATRKSDGDIADTAHLSVYTPIVQASVFRLGLDDVPFFRDARLQRAVGNGMWLNLFADAPYSYRVFDDGAWHEGEGDLNMDIAPRDMTNNRSDVKPTGDKERRTLPGYATGKRRTLVKGREWRRGGNHRQAPYGVEYFPFGQSFLFNHPDYAERSETALFGTPEKPLISTPSVLSTPAGRAFAETYRAEGRSDFR